MDLARAKLIIIMGPPGSGKGTQAKLLREKFGLNYLATGDVVREMCRRAETGDPLGQEVKERYDRGEPQPDDLILRAVRQKLSELDLAKGIIFDAFPLSEPQALGLDEIITEFKLAQPVAINVEVGEDEVVKRLGMRKFCPKDNSVYYPKSPTYEKNQCAVCGGELIRRSDDTPEVARERYRKYIDRITSLVNFYQKRQQLVPINGEQSVPAVAEEIIHKIERYQPVETSA
ncbi:MAG: nucleoside monophosphate kinase [Patescibacteria group bacterium]|nr:nucleoside monophosphate kinase [Patescibacteria group bacterium]